MKHEPWTNSAGTLFGKKRPDWKRIDDKEFEATRRRLEREFAAGRKRTRVMIEYSGSARYDDRRYIDLARRVLSYLAVLGLVAQRDLITDETEAVKSADP